MHAKAPVVPGSIPRETDERYSQRKREWEAQNPDATLAEHTEAMRKIADELGI